MTLLYTKSFLKSVKKLPPNIQEKLSDQLEILQKNPFYPLLRTKPLTGRLLGFYSFRITRDWRVIFRFENQETILLTQTGNRKDIYK
jgi:addiction module RelE/StbE family toxin